MKKPYKPKKVVHKRWGYEVWLCNTAEYCGKIIVVKQEWSSNGRYHYHKSKDETFMITDGILHLDIKGERTYSLMPGDCYRVNANVKHRFKAMTETCTFYEFSTHHSEEDSYYD